MYSILKYCKTSTFKSNYFIIASLLIYKMARVLYFYKSIKLRSCNGTSLITNRNILVKHLTL